MTDERNFTEKELEEMADALLDGDDAGAEEAAAEKPRKKSSRKKDGAAEKTPEERLAELLEKGKKAGKLSSKELECLEDMNLDGEAIDRFYETLEQNGIDIDMPATDVLPPLDDLVPEVDDLSDIEEVTEEEINATDELADTYATDDPVRMYLKVNYIINFYKNQISFSALNQRLIYLNYCCVYQRSIISDSLN